MSLTVNLDGDVPDEVRELAAQLEDPEPVLADFGSHLVHRWTRSFERTGGHQPSDKGEPPAVQSGNLRNSLTWDTSRDSLEAGSRAVYARIQHEGGTIEPDSAKALTIPLTRKAKKSAKRAGDYSGLFFVPSGDGAQENVIGVLAKESGGGIKPIFALAEEVELPARPWMTIEDEDWEYLEDILREELNRA